MGFLSGQLADGLGRVFGLEVVVEIGWVRHQTEENRTTEHIDG